MFGVLELELNFDDFNDLVCVWRTQHTQYGSKVYRFFFFFYQGLKHGVRHRLNLLFLPLYCSGPIIAGHMWLMYVFVLCVCLALFFGPYFVLL